MKPLLFWWGNTKFWKSATWICIFIFSPWGYAAPSDWNIFPSTCISDKPGELCRFEITVEFPQALQNQSENVCFFLNEQQVSCVQSGKDPVKLPIEIVQTSELRIVIDQQLILKKELLVQSLVPKNKRRRVRNPWSFF